MARPSPADTSARSQFGCGCTIYLFVALRLARHARRDPSPSRTSCQ
jgi:hypothetical protein